MTRQRASLGLRDRRLSRSREQVAHILQTLQAPVAPMSEAERLEVQAQLDRQPDAPQLALCLPTNGTGRS